MSYLFLKRYNKAYDYFLAEYFRRVGINFSPNQDFPEIAPSLLLTSGATNLGPEERMLRDYLQRWRLHPEARPSYLEFFDRAVGKESSRGVASLRKLERELPGDEKLLFSLQETSAFISEFYRKYVRYPLEGDMRSGLNPKDLMGKYLFPEEFGRLPDSRSAGVEVAFKEVYPMANRFVKWLSSIDAGRVESDIEKVLVAHATSGNHMGLWPNLDQKGKHRECAHVSELVKISCYSGFEGETDSTFLEPSKGYSAAESVVDPEWNYIVFPQFQVLNE